MDIYPHTGNRRALLEETVEFVVRLAREDPQWGYQRIVGEARKIGAQVSASSVRSILCRHGLGPAPTRSRNGPFLGAVPQSPSGRDGGDRRLHVDTVTLTRMYVYVTWNLSRPITLSRADLPFLQADLASDQVSPALAPIAA